MKTPPPFKTWKNDLISRLFGTGFYNYTTFLQVEGLARIDGTRLNILAIYSQVPGQGNCRKFIELCKANYESIGVWVVDNQVFEQALVRWGFWPAQEKIAGDDVEGLVWIKQQTTKDV